jgi:hypothetical protein
VPFGYCIEFDANAPHERIVRVVEADRATPKRPYGVKADLKQEWEKRADCGKRFAKILAW